MSKVLRRKMVDELAEKLQGQNNLVLVDAQGLTGNQTVELRGSDLAGEINNRVDVSGSAFRSAVPAAP